MRKRKTPMQLMKEINGPIDPARLFVPHDFHTRVLTEIPTIFISPKVMNDMFVLVDESEMEIGWLGLVSRVDKKDFLIEEIFLPEQECHFSSTKLDVDGMVSVHEELMRRPNGAELANRLRFWGHSHVNLDVDPSGKDEQQMEVFKQNKCDFFIRGILNKKARMKFDVFFYDTDIVVLDCPWSVRYSVSDRRLQWRQSIKSKVREKRITYKAFRSIYGDDWAEYARHEGVFE